MAWRAEHALTGADVALCCFREPWSGHGARIRTNCGTGGVFVSCATLVQVDVAPNSCHSKTSTAVGLSIELFIAASCSLVVGVGIVAVVAAVVFGPAIFVVYGRSTCSRRRRRYDVFQ